MGGATQDKGKTLPSGHFGVFLLCSMRAYYLLKILYNTKDMW